jgi:ribosomal protein S18 acetylase RimI-like enzyme
MLVRAARVEDVSQAARVHNESSEAAYPGIPGAPSLARREELWRGVLSNHDRWPYVVEADGEIVGVLIIGPASEDPAAGEVYVIYVHPHWWGTAAAQRLIECAHQQLAARFPRAVLTVLASNARARRFYERNGWELEEVKTDPQPLFGGIPTEVALYRRNLA